MNISTRCINISRGWLLCCCLSATLGADFHRDFLHHAVAVVVLRVQKQIIKEKKSGPLVLPNSSISLYIICGQFQLCVHIFHYGWAIKNSRRKKKTKFNLKKSDIIFFFFRGASAAFVMSVRDDDQLWSCDEEGGTNKKKKNSFVTGISAARPACAPTKSKPRNSSLISRNATHLSIIFE